MRRMSADRDARWDALGRDGHPRGSRGDTAREQMPESQRIDLAFTGGRVTNTERIAGAMIDVLAVQEDDDTLRHRAGHRHAPKHATKSPACAGGPGRRGRLRRVYSTGAAAQACRGDTMVTMDRRPTTGSRKADGDEARARDMRRVWSRAVGSSRLTIAAHGGRCATSTETQASPVSRSPGSPAPTAVSACLASWASAKSSWWYETASESFRWAARAPAPALVNRDPPALDRGVPIAPG